MLAPEGRVIMISGANRGIGRGLAEALYAAGYSLSLGARKPKSLDAVTAGWAPERVLAARYDAEDKQTHRDWVTATVAKFDRIDGLMNNAGIMEDVSIEEGDDEALDRMWAVNVKAPLSMTRLALPHLRDCGAGRIINVASLAGKAVYGSGVGYSMTKFAAVALSHATRHAGFNDGVRCTALCPGYVVSDMTADIASTPQDKMITQEDISSAVLTLLAFSNNASVAELIINCRADVVA